MMGLAEETVVPRIQGSNNAKPDNSHWITDGDSKEFSQAFFNNNPGKAGSLFNSIRNK